MTSLELARWQFGITTLYHFIFVPVTIGLATFTAYCQTRWYRTGAEHWLRATRFWGKLLLISFALGVATGIIQEFQFGMNWSTYSRFVGDVFGAPLAMEGLAAFFVESTFVGLWIFGKGRLSPRVHLATIWAVALATMLSAYFIIAANSWMQHPVGSRVDASGQARLTSIWDVLFQSTAVWSFIHVIAAAWITGTVVVIAVAASHLLRGHEIGVFTAAVRIALPIPHVLSLLATHSWSGGVTGVHQAQQAAIARYGPGNYTPCVPVIYWSFRVMVYGFGLLLGLAALLGWLLFRRRMADSPRLMKIAAWAWPLPFLINYAGWVMTEMGRQPWIVKGLL